MRTYWTLLARNSKTEKWCISFGDYSYTTVTQELEDQKDSGDYKYFTTIATTDSQAAINEAVIKLNLDFS